MLLDLFRNIFRASNHAVESVTQAVAAGSAAAHAAEVDFYPACGPGKTRLLNISCGGRRMDGFVNVDPRAPDAELRIDATKGLPFADNSIDGIRSDDFIERLCVPDAYVFMREARRVLKRDAVLRISIPDPRLVPETFRIGTTTDWESRSDGGPIRSRCEMVNLAMHERNCRYVYDQEKLAELGRHTGFDLLGWNDPGNSAVERFRDLDRGADSMAAEFVAARRIAGSRVGSPKVSILIPAYNPRYFDAALRSAVEQDYANREIIVADDSPGAEIRTIVQEYAKRCGIRYVKNDPVEGPALNYQKLFEISTGDYVKYLNDDDILLPGCVTKLARVLTDMPGVALVTSYRQMINEDGVVQPDGINRAAVVETSALINGQYAAHCVVLGMTNYIGEPSTTMFRKRDLASFGPALFDFFGQEILGNVDVVMWLKLLSAGDLCYLAAPFSQFRSHAEQVGKNPTQVPFLIDAWKRICKQAERVGLHELLPTQAAVRSVDA